jgi:YggT family protein
MIVIGRLYWFVYWAVITAVMALIVLVLLRVIANYADLNPFGWPSLTIRRLTDPFIGPIRRALIGFGVDSKYSPFVTILLAILLAWFVLQLVSSIANTVAGVLLSTESRAIVPVVGYLLYGFLALYTLLIFVRIIFSWGMVSYSNRVMRCLVNTTEPLLGPLRRLIPPLGMFDISPIVAFIIVWLFQQAIAGTLLRGWQLQFFA